MSDQAITILDGLLNNLESTSSKLDYQDEQNPKSIYNFI